MANPEHMKVLAQGAEAWNSWRRQHPKVKPDLEGAILTRAELPSVNLAGADLRNARLEGINLSEAILTSADLRAAHICGAELTGASFVAKSMSRLDPASMDLAGKSITWSNMHGAHISGADLTGADITGANLDESDLSDAILDDVNLTWTAMNGANMIRVKLRRAVIHEAHLKDAHLEHAQLRAAHIEGAKLEGTNLTGADLTDANLCRAALIGANVQDATFRGCFIHGISVWNIVGEPADQRNLRITRSYPPFKEPEMTVDDLEVAQFIYLILNNPKIRNVIDTITSKAVLILGRFSIKKRKKTLEALRDALRLKGYAPILFDFRPSAKRDLTETVQLLANMSRFVVADLTDPKSLPQELSHIIPSLPSVPVQPILLSTSDSYAMFEHWETKYPWVLPVVRYRDDVDLLAKLDKEIISRAKAYHPGRSKESDLERKLEKAKRAAELSTRAKLVERKKNEKLMRENAALRRQARTPGL